MSAVTTEVDLAKNVFQLDRISKQVDPYIRMVLIHGAPALRWRKSTRVVQRPGGV